MVAAPGSAPTATVDRPMINSVATSVVFRPRRSPKWPKMPAPTGREKNAAAKVARDAMVAMVDPRCGKNTWGNTSAAAVP
ncbi:Uncharacterised protein [Mycobacterium tuberculosis]|nr:Uncharacterised protein [Mycobacterium tuberculosis]